MVEPPRQAHLLAATETAICNRCANHDVADKASSWIDRTERPLGAL
jgi:hypothetical protein